MAENYILSPIAERDLLSPEPELQASVSDDIDLFFNTPLDIFPFSETTKKPKRFHVFFGQAIAERFPDDEDMRLYPRLLAMPPPGSGEDHPQFKLQVSLPHGAKGAGPCCTPWPNQPEPTQRRER